MQVKLPHRSVCHFQSLRRNMHRKQLLQRMGCGFPAHRFQQLRQLRPPDHLWAQTQHKAHVILREPAHREALSRNAISLEVSEESGFSNNFTSSTVPESFSSIQLASSNVRESGRIHALINNIFSILFHLGMNLDEYNHPSFSCNNKMSSCDIPASIR